MTDHRKYMRKCQVCGQPSWGFKCNSCYRTGKYTGRYQRYKKRDEKRSESC
jgi:hypothetical protein